MADSPSKVPETPAAAPTAPAPPPKPAVPPKPSPPPRAPAKGGKTRRFFLLSIFGSWAAVGWTTLTASLAGMVLWTLRFMAPNSLSEPPNKFKIPVRDEPDKDGVVVDRFKPDGFWIVRNEGIVYALSTTCTHLGCTPNWLGDKFKCPCHGSGFKITGINFEGPAPRPLERWAIARDADGQLVVDKSLKFQQELGQWSDTKSFIKV
jgi:cytochrome b6-f complex iron-sulfur subunit